MKKTRIGLPVRAGAAVLALACMVGPSALGQQELGSAYQRLRADQLIRQLSDLGMIELLEGLEQQIPANDTSVKALAMRGRIRVGLGLAMARPEDRNRLLDEGIALLKRAVESGEEKSKLTPPQMLELYRYTLDWAVAMGMHRVANPHILRLRYLQGSQQDHEVIRKFTQKAVELMDYLEEDISDKLTEWRPDPNLLMLLVPQLDELESETKYNAAWIRLNRARVLPDGTEKSQLCRDIVAEMRASINDPQSGRAYWALFATGVAYRLVGQHDKADEFLSKAAVPEARSVELRQRAWFERARNRIEEGNPQKTDKAIEEYQQGAQFVFGPGQEAAVDLRVVFLRNYLYQLQAEKLELQAAKEKPGSAKSRELLQAAQARRDKAQETLLWFVERYADRPGLVKAFLDIVATKFADVQDLDKASAVVLLARAYSKLESENDGELSEAEDLLRRVLVHKDMGSARIAQAIRPGALWELAHRMNKRKRNSEAATYFVVLARLYPKHRLAARSAKFAVLSLDGVIKERRAQGKLIESNVRLEFIRALDTYLSGWGQEQGAAVWNYDLAMHSSRLADEGEGEAVKFYWQGRAIAAFENIPSSLVEYMESQHSALELRTVVVLGREDLARQLQPGKLTANPEFRKFAAQMLSFERVDITTAARAGGVAATAPAAGQGLPTAEELDRRVEALAKELNERLKVYADPKALVVRLKSYSDEAAKEVGRIQAQFPGAADKKKELESLAALLREWAAEAEFQAAVIKYEQLTKGMKQADRERTEQEALVDIRNLIGKWPGTPVLRSAYEFEIRKLIERGQTAEAIQKVRDFKAKYPEQADQLIGLVVQQIRGRIDGLRERIKEAVTPQELEQFQGELQRYQLAYVSFAEDLYKPAADAPMDLAGLDRKVKEAEDLERNGDFDALRAMAEELAKLAGAHQVKPEEIKPAEVLANVMADARRASDAAAKKKLLPDLAGAYINAVGAVRDAVRERYALHQMYAAALLEKGEAEKGRQQALDAKAAYQKALEMFQGCYAADEARRQVEAEWLEKKYRPIIDAAKSRARNRDQMRRLVGELRADLTAQGMDPNQTGEVITLEFSYRFLASAGDQEEETKRLPRTLELLLRAWESHLRRLKERTTVDDKNIMGMARAYRGLGQYDKAMEHYRRYTDGTNKVKYPKEYWHSQLERCQCHLEGFRDNPEAMRNLVIQINVLRLEDPAMGGQAPDFEAIRREAQKIAEKAKPAKARVQK